MKYQSPCSQPLSTFRPATIASTRRFFRIMKTPLLKKINSIGLVLVAGVLATRADVLTWDPALNGGSGGAGTWNFNTAANWFNGATDIKWLDNSAAGTNSAVFSGTGGSVALNTSLSTSNLQFLAGGYTLAGSGTLSLGAGGIDASALGSGTTTIGNTLNLTGGQQLWQAGSGSTLAINGAVTRSAGATVDFSTTGVTSSSLTNINGIIGGWATTGDAISSTTTGDWAATNGAGGIITYTGYNLVTGAQTGAGASAQNWKNTSTTTLSASATINSLVAAFDIGPNSGVTTTIGSGGLILQGISRWIINSGGGNYSTGTLIPGTTSGEFFIHAPNGDIIPNTAAGNNWRMWPQIKDNGATPTILVKDGPGMVSLMNTNSYTGGTIINNGILVVNKSGSTTANLQSRNWSALGFGAVTVNGPGIFEVGYGTGTGVDFLVTNSFVLNGGKYLANDGTHRLTGPISITSYGATFGSTYDGGTKGLFLDGLISGSGPITVQQAYQAGEASFYNNPDGNAFNSSVVYFVNNANTYSGTVTLIPYNTGSGAGSYLALNGSTALQNASLYLDNNTSGHRYAASGGVFSALVFNTGLGSATIGAISGPGNIILNGFNEANYVLQTDAIALTVGGNNASTTHSGIITGSGSLTKIGNGTLTLSGVNTYTGNTVVNGGRLTLNGAWVNSTNITVGSGATFDVSALGAITLSGSQTLSGSGTNNGSVNTTSGSKIYAGTDGAYGTNRFNNDLTLVSGAQAYFDVGTLVSGSNDLITVAGTLTANNNSIHLKAPSGASLQTADFTLIASANPISGSFNGTPIWDAPPVNAGNFSIVTSGSTVKLHYSANSAPSGAGFATPSSVTRNQKTLLTVVTANGVPGTVQTVVVDASSIGGSASFSLVRSNLSNVFTNTIAPTAATTAGGKTLPATITDSTPLNAIANIALTVTTTNDVWNGAAANDLFSSNLNWLNNAAPGLIGDSLQFGGTTRLTPSMDNSYTVTSLLFDSTAGSFTIGTANSSVLTLAGAVTNNSVNAQTLNVPITLDTAQTINTAAGNVALGGVITGLGSLSKIGNGTLTLSGTGNNLSGTVGVTGGALNISSGSTAFGTGFSYAGFRTDSGTLNLTGGNFTTGGDFGVGYSDLNGTTYNATGIVTVVNATVSLGGKLIVARGNNNLNTVSGTVTLNSGGTLNSEGDVLLGFAGNNNLGKVVINGGTLNVATVTTRWLIMGQYDTSQSEVDLNSGNVNINGNSAIRFATGNNTGTNIFNLNGGAVTFYGDNATTVGGTGVLDLHQGNGSSVVNTFNLNGGTLTVPGIISANATGTRTFNFNGGTLVAPASSGTFLNLGTGSTVANVRNGGAIIDDGGFTINIDQTLVHSTIAGDNAADGGLTKSGIGTLTLTGVETYTGGTKINAGTLALSGSSSINNSSNILVGSGATFDVSGIAFTLGGSQSLSGSGFINGSVTTTAGSKIYAGTDGVYGTNTFNSDLTLVSGTACYLDLGRVNNLTNDQLVVNGTLTANNNVIHLKAPSTSVNLDTTADYVLISAGAITGSFASAPVWDVAPANAGHYSIVTGSSTVTLHYNAAASAPTVTASANPTTLLRNQPTRISANVTPGSASISTVTIDLSPLGGSTLSLVRSNLSNFWTNTVVVPASASGNVSLTVTATDSATSSGSAAVPLTIITSTEVWNGAGGNPNWSTNPNWVSTFAPGYIGDDLVFAGTVGLAPNMDANYTVNSLTFSNTAGSFNIGTASGSTLTLAGGAVVNKSANAQTLNVPVTLTAAQTFNVSAGSLTVSGAIADAGGGLTKTGNNSLILSGNNTFTGPVTVSAGTLAIPATGLVAPNALVNVSDPTGVKAILNIAGGNLQANSNPGQFTSSLTIGSSAGAVGDLQLGAGGTLSVLQQFAIGTGAGGYAAFEMSGGTATIGSFMVVGFSGDRSVFSMTNGSLTLNNNLITIAAGGASSIGVANISGGTVSSAATTGYGPTIGGMFVGEFGSGTLNVSGTAALSLSGLALRLGQNGGANGVVNLNGGTITTTAVSQGGGNGTLNFNGGTLQASAAGTFLTGLNSANVFGGGAIIDDGGNAITVAQPLLAPTGYGVSSIGLSSGGTGYFAPPLVVLTNGTGSGARATAKINPVTGAVTGIVINNPGTGYLVSDVITVSFIGGGGTGAVAATPLLAQNTSGGLTKLGAGTLTLSGANTYTGNTTVNAGTLEIAQPVLAGSSTVTVAGGAILQLDFGVTNRVSGLVLNGVTQATGVYNLATSAPYIAGAGSLLVSSIASNPTNITFSVSGNTLALTWPADHLGWILQSQTNSLNTGLSTNWFDVAGSATVISTNINMNPAVPTAFYRLRQP